MNMGRRGEIMGRVQRTMNPKGRVRKTDGTVSHGTPALEDGHYGRGFLLCERLGIDLGKAVREKFNEVSDRVGSRVYLP